MIDNAEIMFLQQHVNFSTISRDTTPKNFHMLISLDGKKNAKFLDMEKKNIKQGTSATMII